jgi:hypothetical protein
MKERVLRIGKPIPLVGIATEPPEFDSNKPALVILNSGVMHHVGACRLSVKIARSVAALGFLAVRFDFSGIGDSEPRRGSDAFEVVSVRECQEVMDYLEKTRGISKFILYGLCSGADASYHTALADARVIGFSQIDAYCYVTLRFYLHHFLPILFQTTRWKRFLGNQYKRLFSKDVAHGAEPSTIPADYFEVPTYTRIFPPQSVVARGLTELVSRNVKMQVIFTGGEPLFNYRRQYEDSFKEVPFGDCLTVEYFPETNHIITQPEAQNAMVRAVANWVGQLNTGGDNG